MVSYKKLGKLLLWRCRQKKAAGGGCPVSIAADQEVEEAPSVLLPCVSCGRTFRPEALAKHSKVCEKTLMKKRKAFDSSKQRLQGTEVDTFSKEKQKKSRPKEKPERKVDLGKVDLGKVLQKVKRPEPPQPVKPSDHSECPFCGRHFGPKAFDRHTEFCKEQQYKIKNSPNINLEAKERLKVRTSYRGPLTNKVLNRDRYQPKRDPSPMSCESHDGGPKGRGLSRSDSMRSSMRRNASDSAPPPPLRRSNTQIRGSVRRKGELVEVNPPTPSNEQYQVMPRLHHREQSDRNDVEKYNPFLSAERQMKELFGAEEEDKTKPPPTTLPEIQSSSPLQSSLSSAFVKYSSPVRSSSLENLSKENNNNLHSSEPLNKPPNFSMSNLSLCSVVSLDSVDCNRNSRPMVERSFSALEGKPVRGIRNKVNIQEMLYGAKSPEVSINDGSNIEACEAELLISMLEFEKILKSSPLPPPSPQSSPTLCSSTQHENNSKQSVEAEKRNNLKNVNHNSIDSAYSSLTRSGGGDSGDSGQPGEQPNFCHECGAKYPVPGAKFCCICGMKRVIL